MSTPERQDPVVRLKALAAEVRAKRGSVTQALAHAWIARLIEALAALIASLLANQPKAAAVAPAPAAEPDAPPSLPASDATSRLIERLIDRFMRPRAAAQRRARSPGLSYPGLVTGPRHPADRVGRGGECPFRPPTHPPPRQGTALPKALPHGRFVPLP